MTNTTENPKPDYKVGYQKRKAAVLAQATGEHLVANQELATPSAMEPPGHDQDD